MDTMDVNAHENRSTTTVKTTSKRMWSDYEWLAERGNLTIPVAKNILKMFEEDATVPFIARYRKNLTNGMSAEQLRQVKESVATLKAVRKKCDVVLKELRIQQKFDGYIEIALLAAKSVEEIEHIYAPFKPSAKKTLVERAKEIGLEDSACSFFNSINPDVSAIAKLKNLKVNDINNGIVHIISHQISHNPLTFEFIRKLYSESRDITIKSSISRSIKGKNVATTQKDVEKFSNYFEFSKSITQVKAHQTLALNRGEKLKILSVKVVISLRISREFEKFCNSQWRHLKHKDLFRLAVKDAFNRYVEPLLIRLSRSDLKAKAERSSIQTFEENLRNMLLEPPLKGNKILAIDPGLRNGCKLALISETGSVLATNVVHLKFKCPNNDKSAMKMVEMLNDHNCNVIALGNGKACRETEAWINELKSTKLLSDALKVLIVDESGASIYSCTKEAKDEFPDLDYNLISAVSLARRVQDPLSELIKIEPKHLGVGMYQHDLKEKVLTTALDQVIVECVSFVGVDINTASVCLLRKVAGLNSKTANNIIAYREKQGYFKNRKQIRDIKGIGDKIFEQCSGFLRVCPTEKNQEIEFYDLPDTDKLDRTCIHPESYPIAKKLISECKLSVKNLGNQTFIRKVEEFLQKINMDRLVEKLGTNKSTLELITKALVKPIDLDFRLKNVDDQLFSVIATTISTLREKSVITGRVQNVTDFGSFVDIGVESDGLIHISNSNGVKLNRGDTVQVEILSVDVSKQRVGLKLLGVNSKNRNVFE